MSQMGKGWGKDEGLEDLKPEGGRRVEGSPRKNHAGRVRGGEGWTITDDDWGGRLLEAGLGLDWWSAIDDYLGSTNWE